MIRVLPMTTDELAGLEAADDRAGVGALATERGNLPLDTLDLTARITGLTAHTELTQGFHNPYDQPLEATYVFPLPDRAAVTAMRMEAAGRVVEGVLKERQQAREEYDEAIAKGQRASIAEEERPDVFTMRVGNIMPGERVTVRLRLAGAVPYEDGAATYRFPLVVAPRYIPGTPLDGAVGAGTEPDTDAVPDASRITPPVLLPGFPNPVRLGIAVTVDPAGMPLRSVTSSLHQIDQTEDDGLIRIAVHPGERANRDFVLRWEPAVGDAVTESLVVAPDTDDAERGTFQLTLLPPAVPRSRTPKDVVLVLDRSGSMGGWKMVAARRAAARIVDSLTGEDRFGVIAFDNVTERPPELTEGLVAATDRHRFRAVEFLAGLRARGGTVMLGPLTQALALLNDPERELVLVLVTDGQVGNEDQILRELAPSLGRVRVHTVGIDQAVNAGFLGRLASAGGGRCELVESEDRLDDAMDRIHRRIATPLVTGLRLAPDGLGVDLDSVSPSRLPDLFTGVPVRISGRYAGRPTGAVTVTGARPDGVSWQARAVATSSDNPALGQVWARGRLRDLEDHYVTHTGPDKAREALERTIVETSLRYGVLCRFTAFVAVDSRVAHQGGELHRVVQPVEAPAGWQLMAAASPLMAGTGQIGDAAMLRGRAMAAPAALGVAAGGTDPRQMVDPAAELRRQATDELRTLTTLADRGAIERWNALADLASRLTALVRHLRQAGVAESDREALRRLAEELSVCENPPPPEGAMLDRLWRQAVEVLEHIAGGDPATGGDSATPPPAARRSRTAFWKR
ncbi:MAG: VIT domain-containing protein [Micromonosporaceae bacterium]